MPPDIRRPGNPRRGSEETVLWEELATAVNSPEARLSHWQQMMSVSVKISIIKLNTVML